MRTWHDTWLAAECLRDSSLVTRHSPLVTGHRRGDVAPLHLAGGGARDALDDEQLLRDLEVGQVRAAVAQQLPLARLAVEDHRRGDLLAPDRVRQAERDCLADRGVL